ncbi:MAG TPA: hypothetical protein VFA17_00105 [Thermoplasmata archaeon]|jgi:hypothetical protein|nr:hypothetical protein [Thermoplasmata archaeon]
MTRFRFRRGSVELEIEYSTEIPSEDKELITSLMGNFEGLLSGRETPIIEEDDQSEAPTERTEKKSKRGGARRPFVAPGVDNLIATKWLVEKTTDEVVSKLKADGIVGANEDNVASALLRKVQRRALVRTERDGEWVWTIPTL